MSRFFEGVIVGVALAATVFVTASSITSHGQDISASLRCAGDRHEWKRSVDASTLVICVHCGEYISYVPYPIMKDGEDIPVATLQELIYHNLSMEAK
jgi:hypothetical protein